MIVSECFEIRRDDQDISVPYCDGFTDYEDLRTGTWHFAPCRDATVPTGIVQTIRPFRHTVSRSDDLLTLDDLPF